VHIVVAFETSLIFTDAEEAFKAYKDAIEHSVIDDGPTVLIHLPVEKFFTAEQIKGT
jgi:hypothetical protein